MSRGIKHDIDRWVNDLQAQYFPYTIGGKPGHVQLAMRPVQFWEIVFPKESLNDVLRIMDWTPDQRPELKLPFAAIRKFLKAKKIPKNIDLSTTPKRILYDFNVAKYVIGMREDGVWPEDHPMKGAEQL